VKYIKRLFILSVLLCILGLAAVTGIYFYIKPDLPSVAVLKEVRLQTPMKIYTQDGLLISQYGVKRRIPLLLKDVPEQLIQAVLATEDSRFYDHPGIDPIGMMRALVNLVMTGEKGQGGSTLTMQLARDFFLTRDKTYIRKIREMFIAWHMEQLLSKEEILELYLNKVELGHRSFGFGAAAQVYYGKDVSDLSLAEIATIAGLPKAPSTLNPISRPDRSVERRRVVLLRMLDEEFITRAEFDLAAAEPVTANKHGAEIDLDAPYLADIIYNEMVELYGKEEAETGGYQVYATAPAKYQEAAQKAVVQNLHDYDERHGYRGPIAQLWEPLPKLQADQQADQQMDESETSGRNVDSQETSTESVKDTRPDPRWDEAQMAQAIATVVVIDPLIPAIVTEVNEDSIEVFDNQSQYRLIEWNGLMWARAYIDDSHQGQPPKLASDIVKQGALIWIRERAEDGVLQLAQIPKASGALVAMDPNSGAVKAVVGGYSFYESQFNRATQAKRQVGSNIKPFIYSAALENGYTLASLINDAPINQWDSSTGVAWRPKNSDGKYEGPIRMRVALGKSKNVVSVRLLRSVGIDRAVEHLSKFGFDRSEIPKDETLSLGSGSHTPLEVVTGVATIANGGYSVQPHFIDRITDEHGEELWAANPAVACDNCEMTTQIDSDELDSNEIDTDAIDTEAMLAAQFGLLNEDVSEIESAKPQAERVISAQNAFLVREMMRTAVRGNGLGDYYWRGSGWRARSILQRTDLAGKTGTTNDARDTWFSGIAPNLVATSWVGFDDMSRKLGAASPNQPLINLNPQRYTYIGNALIGSEEGAKAAQPAWIRFMQVALQDIPYSPMAVPEDIIQVRIDRTTGKLTKRTDRSSMFEYFLVGTEPTANSQQQDLKDPFVTDNGVELPEEEIF
jgi:penicillin-binding protein 1A